MLVMNLSSLQGERRRWAALGAVLLAQLMIVLDATIVNVALPAIQTDLHFSPVDLTWVVDAYLITFGSFLLARRTARRPRRPQARVPRRPRRSSPPPRPCAASPRAAPCSIAARFVQGLGGAVSSAVILAILATEFPRRRRARAGDEPLHLRVGGGGSVGLLAGGALTQAIDWHWIFFVNVPIGLVTRAGRALARSRRARASASARASTCSARSLVTAAMALGVYAIVEAPPTTAGRRCTRSASARWRPSLLAAFLALEARLENPILPLRMLRMRTLAGSSVVRGADGHAGCSASFFLGALYLERVRGYGALAHGQAFLPLTLDRRRALARPDREPRAALRRRTAAARGPGRSWPAACSLLDRRRRRPPTSRRVFVAFLLWASARARRSCRC